MRWVITAIRSALLISLAGTALAGDGKPALREGKPAILNLGAFRPTVPFTAIRGHISGDVLVQFRLDDKGRAQDVRVVLAEPRGIFDKHALRAVAAMRFSLPPEWLASHPKRLLELAFVYLINRCMPGDPFPGIHTITVRASGPMDPPADEKLAECAKTGAKPQSS